MDDNAKPHNSDKCLEYMGTLGIKTLAWPPYSPDLNPIENMWALLKRKVYANNTKYANEEAIMPVIHEKLEELNNDTELFKNLYKSMPRRVAACIEAQGGHFGC